jgi:hypothetical protein
MPPSIAYFITPHGFGHATRAAAVMAAIHARHPSWRLEIFTQVPRWVFEDSLTGPFDYHSVLTDVGLAQLSPMLEDLEGTVERLNGLLPFREAVVRQLAEQVGSSGCAVVVCDIAPLGIAVARAVGIPSILVENFTWDWIYEAYAPAAPGLQPHIDYLRSAFADADYLVQIAPVCAPRPAHLTTNPVSRSPRTPPAAVRDRLAIPPDAKAVFLTMGGFDQPAYRFLEQANGLRDTYFVIPGSSHAVTERRGNAILLPDHTAFFHPDLLNACDVVVGKLGYSTCAETYYAGLPYGYVARSRLRESAVLGPYARQMMGGIEITLAEFEHGRWLRRLPDLLARPRLARDTTNGAEEVGEFVGRLVNRRSQ